MTKNGTARRIRRTPEQMIADLQAEIERVKTKAAAKEAKATGGGRAYLAAVKAVDKALEVADDKDMKRALESARATLGEQLVRMGLRMPDERKRRGRPRKVGVG